MRTSIAMSSLVGVLAAALGLLFPAPQRAQDETVIQVKRNDEFGFPPVRIEKIRVGATDVKVRKKFLSDENFFRDLKVEVRNVSPHTIQFVRLRIVFPRKADDSDWVIPPHHLTKGRNYWMDPNPVEGDELSLEPNQTTVLSPTSECLERLRSETANITKQQAKEITIEAEIAIWETNQGWNIGYYVERVSADRTWWAVPRKIALKLKDKFSPKEPEYKVLKASSKPAFENKCWEYINSTVGNCVQSSCPSGQNPACNCPAEFGIPYCETAKNNFISVFTGTNKRTEISATCTLRTQSTVGNCSNCKQNLDAVQGNCRSDDENPNYNGGEGTGIYDEACNYPAPITCQDFNDNDDDQNVDSNDTDCICTSPIIIDVLGNGYNLTSHANGVIFDINGNGVASERLGWTAANSDDAFLAMDRNGDGQINDGTELFGCYTPQPAPPRGERLNGFLALAVFDENGDGQIDARDPAFSYLRLWRDANRNGVSDVGELRTLTTLGIVTLDLDYRESKRTDEHGNQFKYRAKVTDANGAQIGRWAWDIFLAMQR